MNANFNKCKIVSVFLCVIMFLTTMPVKVIMAAEQTKNVITEVEETKEAEDTSKKHEVKSSLITAGAATLLNTDIVMQDEELVELVKSNTTEAIEVKTLEKPAEESDLVMANVNEYVNVRAEATQDSEKLGQLYKDCGGHIIEQKDGWTKMQSGNVTGWVRDDFLLFGEEAETLAKEVGMLTATSTTQSLRVRKEPNLDAGILGLLAENETMEAISEDGEWVSVSYEGTTAYVSAEYVTVDFQLDVAESMEEIKAREAAELEAKRNVQKEAIMANSSDLDVLAALIQCEAGGEPYEGQLAVGAVVMNRVRCGGYPNTIKEVIYASGQFSPASSGKMTNLILNGNIKESCRQAAQEAVNGVCNVGDSMHFRRVGSKQGIIIGNHVFW